MPPAAEDDDLASYYAHRAQEYERIYARPERQADLALLKQTLPELLAGRTVLEIACGTGFWTQYVAARALSVCATDINEEVLELARLKPYPRPNVRFARVDIYDSAELPGAFDAGLAAFWWSHVPRQDLAGFLAGFHRRLRAGARVVLLDNRYVEGSSTPITRTDERGNTYQMRSLEDGTRYEILKNFPDEEELRRVLAPVAEGIAYRALDYFWYVTYRVVRNA